MTTTMDYLMTGERAPESHAEPAAGVAFAGTPPELRSPAYGRVAARRAAIAGGAVNEVAKRAAAIRAAEGVSKVEAAPPAAYRSEIQIREAAAVESAVADDGRGAILLDLIARYLEHYVAISERNRDAVTLWIGHAAARHRDDTGLGRLIWRASPRLMLTSSDRGSGKSTVLDLSRILLENPPRISKVTGRSLASRLGRKHQAVMLDEVKLLFGAGQASKDVQGVLLDGYTPGGVWGTTSGQQDVDIPCFGPVAYAAKDELVTATADQLGDLFDRTITVRMTPAPRIMPEVDEIAEEDGAQLSAALVMWTDMNRERLRLAARQLAIADRERAVAKGEARLIQIWRPLRAVAAVAGDGWPGRALDAMSAMRPAGERPEGKADVLDDALASLEARFASRPVTRPADDDDDDDWGE